MQPDGLQPPSPRHKSVATRKPKRKSNDTAPQTPAQTSTHAQRGLHKKRKGNHGSFPTSTPISESENQYRVSHKGDLSRSAAQPAPNRSDLDQSYQCCRSPLPCTTDPSVPDLSNDLEHYDESCSPREFWTSRRAADRMPDITLADMLDLLSEAPPPEPPEPRIPPCLQIMPPEILHRVCRYLEEDDVRNFRFTTKKHAAIADEHMFRLGTFHLHLYSDHFNRLRTISKNPMICKGIKLLEISGHQDDFNKLINHIAFPAGSKLKGRHYSDSVECIQKFKNLETIEMRIGTPQLASLEPSWRYNLSRQMHIMLSDIQCLPCINIKYLQCEGVGWQSPCCVDARLSPSTFNLKIHENAAERLLRLDLTIPIHPPNPERNLCQDLVHYLQYTKNLEEIKLTLGRRDVPFSVPLDDFLSLRLSRLRSVDICFARVAERDLLSFLHAHSALKELRLGFMILREGTWTLAVSTMALVMRRLTKISFFGQLLDTRLMETRTTLCGESFTPWAHKMVILKQPGLNIVYPANPLAVALASVRRDRQSQQVRKAAGLPCPLCDSCGQMRHS